MNKETYSCPVCDTKLDFQPWNGKMASLEICPSCMIHFGYDDGQKEKSPMLYKLWRDVWLKNGKKKLTNEQIDEVHQQANELAK